MLLGLFAGVAMVYIHLSIQLNHVVIPIKLQQVVELLVKAMGVMQDILALINQNNYKFLIFSSMVGVNLRFRLSIFRSKGEVLTSISKSYFPCMFTCCQDIMELFFNKSMDNLFVEQKYSKFLKSAKKIYFYITLIIRMLQVFSKNINCYKISLFWLIRLIY